MLNISKTHEKPSQSEISIVWHIDDVKSVRSHLTDEQCFEVLEACRDNHEADVGINWYVIEFHADDLFPVEN